MRIRSMRIASQTLFFLISWIGLIGVSMTGLVYPYFFCVASPGACAGCPLGTLQHGFAHTGTTPMLLFLIGFFGLSVLVFGRAACGWACPIGFINEILYKIRTPFLGLFRAMEKPLEPAARASVKLGMEPKYYKYLILILIPVASFITGKLIFTMIDPIGGLVATIPTLLLVGGYNLTQPLFTIKMILVLMVIVMGLLIMRSWCRFLCPLGAAMAPGNKVSMLSLSFNKDSCTNCNACIQVCPMNVDIFNDRRSLECILCGRCVEACNGSSLEIQFLGKPVLKK